MEVGVKVFQFEAEVYRSIYTRGPQGHSNPTMRQSASAFQVHIIVMSGYYIVILVVK